METFFHFSFTNPGGFLISFIPAMINFCLFGYIVLYLPFNKITNVFTLLTLALCTWQMNDALSRISANMLTAEAWDHFFSISWMFAGALGLHFTLLYTGMTGEKQQRLINILIYAPSFFFAAFYNAGVFPARFHYDGFWGWVNNHDQHILETMCIWWIGLLQVVSTAIMVWYTRSAAENSERKLQSMLIAVGIAVPTVAGVAGQLLLPFVFRGHAIPVTSTCMTIFSLTTVIALSRYKLFRVSDLISAEKLLETIPSLFICANPEGNITYMNRYTRAMFGKAVGLDDTSLFNLLEFAGNNYRDAFRRAVDLAMQGKETSNQESSIILNERLTHVLINIRPLYNNGELQAVIVSMRDITEMRKSHELIVKNENQLREAQQIARVGSWEWDIITNEITWSDELYRIFGLQKTHQDLSYEAYLEALHPEDREQVNGIIQNAYETRQGFSFYHRVKGNEDTIIHSRGNVVLNDAGEPVRMCGTGQDVTEMLRNEARLKKQNEELQKINSELDRFVYSVSHDLRSPLTSMQGLITLAQEETSDPVMKEYFALLHTSSLKLDKFIIDILDYSRNARLSVKLAEMDIQELIDEIVSGYLSQSEHQVSIEVDITSICPLVSDRTRLMMVFNNLISNAVRYTDREAAHSYVHIKGDINRERALISVIDNGIGIPPEIQPRIFEMFFRGARESPGSGLGLYIVREALEKLEGSIRLDSEPGKGTIFIVEIPNRTL